MPMNPQPCPTQARHWERDQNKASVTLSIAQTLLFFFIPTTNLPSPRSHVLQPRQAEHSLLVPLPTAHQVRIAQVQWSSLPHGLRRTGTASARRRNIGDAIWIHHLRLLLLLRWWR